MRIIFFIMLILPSILLSYPLFLSSGHTNHPKVLELSGLTGLKPTDLLEPTEKKAFAINNAILIVSNQEKPNQRITIKINKLLPQQTEGKVKVLLDSVSFIGVDGSYQIEETGQNQFDMTPTPPPAPTPAPTMVDKGTAQAGAMRKK